MDLILLRAHSFIQNKLLITELVDGLNLIVYLFLDYQYSLFGVFNLGINGSFAFQLAL